MHDLPSILLSYNVELRKSGNRYMALCIAHDETRPSMAVYINGTGKYTTHCYRCGFHEDAIGVVAFMEGIPNDVAYKKMMEPSFDGRSKYARIVGELPPPKPVRITMPPPPDTPMPKMDWLVDRDTGEPFGEPVAVYTYRTADGDPWFYESRFMVNGRKQPRCWSWGQLTKDAPLKWQCSFPTGIRPMYGLDVIIDKPAAQVVLCEGPRKAEAAQKLFPSLACVGYAGGAGAWKHTDWEPLRGRKVIMWPDADETGRTNFAALGQHLLTLDCQVWILNTDDKPDGWDAADAVDEGMTTETAMEWAKANKGDPVKVIEVVEPEPVAAPAPPIEAYIPAEIDGDDWTKEPADLFAEFIVPELKPGMLPKVVEDFVTDRAYIINTDACFGALSCIVTAAGVIDDRIKLEVGYEWSESARLWGCIVGESSTKKSPMLMAVTKPLNSLIEKVAREDAEIARRQDIIDARYKAAMKKYTEACIASDDHDTPMPPMAKREERLRVKVQSLTTEGLEEVLRDCPRGIFCDVDELAGWLGSMDAYRAQGKKDRGLWLQAYNGGALQKDLVGRGSFLIHNWSVTILGGIQPSKIRELAPNMSDDGLLQRFIVVCSEKPGGPARSDVKPNIPAIEAWHELIDTLYHTKPGGSLVKMTLEAAAIREDAVHTISNIINSRYISLAFTSALGKWEGVSARLILVYHCIACAVSRAHPESVPVSALTAQTAMNYLMNHLLPHAVSFYEDGLGQSESQAICKLIADAIVAQGMPELTTRWLAQFGPNKWRTATETRQREVLMRLIELGWIQSANMAENITRRPTRYRVNPYVHELCIKHKSLAIERIQQQRDIGKRIRAGSLMEHNRA